jgi:hypothetical protein
MEPHEVERGIMATSQRLSRGFHRLALFLAAIPLVIGGSLSVYIAFDLANRLWEQHRKLVCAHELVPSQKPGENPYDQFDTIKLKQIGCSNSDDTVTVGEARNPPPNLNWFAEFGSALLLSPLPHTLIVTLAVYAMVRAIGWVVGGFMAS